MNQEQTPPQPAMVSVINYADGVNNLELSDGENTRCLNLSDEQAKAVCEFFGVDVPNTEPEPPTQLE